MKRNWLKSLGVAVIAGLCAATARAEVPAEFQWLLDYFDSSGTPNTEERKDWICGPDGKYVNVTVTYDGFGEWSGVSIELCDTGGDDQNQQ
jgi:hypothetical protein